MNFKITHEIFKHLAKHSPQLLLDVFNVENNLFKTLTNNINKFTKKYNSDDSIVEIYENYIREYHYRLSETEDVERMNKLKGDLFEIFGEIFFKSLISSKDSGITEFVHVDDIDDVGVDATGMIGGENVAIQFKYRGNSTEELSAKQLNNFMGMAYALYNVNIKPNTDENDNSLIKRNLILFTNCNGVHWSFEKNTASKIWVYSKNSKNGNLNKILNNNDTFWKNCFNIIKENIENI